MQILDAHYLELFKIRFRFSDQYSVIIDLWEFIKNRGGKFEQLTEAQKFRQFQIAEGGESLDWKAGVVLEVETLYTLALNQKPEDFSRLAKSDEELDELKRNMKLLLNQKMAEQ